jgi:hypothetical protein
VPDQTVAELLNDDFRFLIEEEGFCLVGAPAKDHAEMRQADIHVALRYDAKDEAFAVVIWRDGYPQLLYPLIDYVEFFDQIHRYRYARDIPAARTQASQLKMHLRRIVTMLEEGGSGPRWEAFRTFHGLNR